MLRISLARVGLGTGPALTGPACLVCGAAPVLMPPLTSVGLLGAAAVLHYLLWVLAPLNLVPLWLGFRHHRNPSALLLAGLGASMVLIALLVHGPYRLLPDGLHDLIWLGVLFLIAGAMVDWSANQNYVRKWQNQ